MSTYERDRPEWNRLRTLVVQCIRLACTFSVWACADGASVTTPPVVAIFHPAPPRDSTGLTSYHITGRVIDESGRPVTAALIYLSFVVDPKDIFQHASTMTDSAGRYVLEFRAVSGAMHGPPGTSSAFAFGYVEKNGYDQDSRYFLTSAPADTVTTRLHAYRRIAAGDSATLDVDASSPVCSNNVQDLHPWPEEWICRTIHVVAAQAGRLIITVTGEHPTVPVGIEVEPWRTVPLISFDGPIAIDVDAGVTYDVNVEIPFGSSGETVVVRTELRP